MALSVNESLSTSGAVQWMMDFEAWQHERHFFPKVAV